MQMPTSTTLEKDLTFLGIVSIIPFVGFQRDYDVKILINKVPWFSSQF